MRFGFIGSRPLHLVPLFHPFPLHTLLFPLSFHVFPCFMSCHLTPLFLLRAHNGPGLSLHAHIHGTLRFQGRPGSDNEVWLTVCLCASGPLFIATTYTFALSCPLFMSSSFCPWLRAPAHTRLNLSFRLPSGLCVRDP